MDLSSDPIVLQLMEELGLWHDIECFTKDQDYDISLYSCLIGLKQILRCSEQLGCTGIARSDEAMVLVNEDVCVSPSAHVGVGRFYMSLQATDVNDMGLQFSAVIIT